MADLNGRATTMFCGECMILSVREATGNMLGLVGVEDGLLTEPGLIIKDKRLGLDLAGVVLLLVTVGL